MSSKSLLQSKNVSKPQTILEYLANVMTTDELNQLYQDQFTTLTLFRTLPTLSKQYLIRLMLLSPLTPIPRSLLLSWHYSSITKESSPIHKDALICMTDLKLLIKYTSPSPPNTPLPTKSLVQTQGESHFFLNPFFHHSLRTALATTNPLKLHLSPLILPKQPHLSSPSSSSSSTHISSKQDSISTKNNKDDNNKEILSGIIIDGNGIDDKKDIGVQTGTNKLKFKRREIQIEKNIPLTSSPSTTTTTTTTTITKPIQSNTMNDNNENIDHIKREKFKKINKKNEKNEPKIRFELPLPPLFKGDAAKLLGHIKSDNTFGSSPSLPSGASGGNSVNTGKNENFENENFEENLEKNNLLIQKIFLQKLPVLDIIFLDNFANDQINSISLFIFNLLPSTYPSLIYPSLPPSIIEQSNMINCTKNEKMISLPTLTGLSPFLMDLLQNNNIITYQGYGSNRHPVVSSEGLTYVLKQPQDRAWALLLMYFDSIRFYHLNEKKNQNNQKNIENNQSNPNLPSKNTQNIQNSAKMTDSDGSTNTSTTINSFSSSSPSNHSSNPSTLSIPSLGSVFQFLFHLSFAPLGTALPAVDLTQDQLHVLFHLSEFGLLYPLYSTQVTPNPALSLSSPPPTSTSSIPTSNNGIIIPTGKLNQQTTDGGNMNGKKDQNETNSQKKNNNSQQQEDPRKKQTQSSHQIPPYQQHGLLGFYPTRLLTNLSSSLKGNTFISTSRRQYKGGKAGSENSGSNNNFYDDDDDDDNDGDYGSYGGSSGGSSSSSGIAGGSGNGQNTGVLSITEQAFSALTKDLSTPHGISINASKRFIIVETTLKVYAFTTNPLYIKIMSYFVEFQVKLPNLCVGFITRKSIQNAIQNGITSQNVIDWLTQHSHERMIRNAMGEFDQTLGKYKSNRDIILPINVMNQINIWSTEQDRFDCRNAVIIEGFSDLASFQQWERLSQSEELRQKLENIYPTSKRPQTPIEYQNFDWDSIWIEPPVVLYKNRTPNEWKLVISKEYFQNIKERYLKQQQRNVSQQQ